jgi:hypothetical protein
MIASITIEEGCNGTFHGIFTGAQDAQALSLDKGQSKGQSNSALHPINAHSDRGGIRELYTNEIAEIILKSLSERDGQLLATGDPISLLLPLDAKETLEEHIDKLVWILRTDQRLLIVSGKETPPPKDGSKEEKDGRNL